jgi:hypothetical protein
LIDVGTIAIAERYNRAMYRRREVVDEERDRLEMEKHGGFNVSWVEEQAHVALYPEWLSPGGGGSAAIRIRYHYTLNYGGPQRTTWSTLGLLGHR